MEVYLDNAATTKAAKEVVDMVSKVMLEDYGNPSSKHIKGVTEIGRASCRERV